VSESGSPTADELIRRLRVRAADPERRVDVRQDSFSARVMSLDLGSLFGALGSAAADLRRVVADNQAGRVDPEMVAKANRIGAQMATPVEAVLSPPASSALVDRVEAELGFSLPALHRRVYSEVGDGGFGPHGGLLGIQAAAAAYARMRAGTGLPRGRTWPERLLPVVAVDVGFDCVDCSSADGPVVAWDPEELGEFSGEKAWTRSFSQVAPSVEAWLTEWVGGKTQAEEHEELMRQAMIDGVRQSRAYFAAMTPEQRAEYGLPETGWESQIGGHLGLDDDLDKPG
jgi:hypothetical protein